MFRNDSDIIGIWTHSNKPCKILTCNITHLQQDEIRFDEIMVLFLVFMCSGLRSPLRPVLCFGHSVCEYMCSLCCFEDDVKDIFTN